MPYEHGSGWRLGNGTLPDGSQGYGWTYGPTTTWRPEPPKSMFPDTPPSAGTSGGFGALVGLIVLGVVLQAMGVPVVDGLSTGVEMLRSFVAGV
jgi:hypothetical protein